MDADLTGYLDRHFAEVRSDIAARAVNVKEELRAEIVAGAASVKDELRAEIVASAVNVKEELRAEIVACAASVKDELRAEIVASAARLHREMSAETTRHIDTVVEDLISKMELVGEGVRTVDRRLDRFSDEVREEFQKVDRRLLQLHARISVRRRRRPGR